MTKDRAESVREIARIRIGEDSFPYSLNIDRTGKRAYVACNSIAELPVIDLDTDAVIARVPVKSDGGLALETEVGPRAEVEAAVRLLDELLGFEPPLGDGRHLTQQLGSPPVDGQLGLQLGDTLVGRSELGQVTAVRAGQLPVSMRCWRRQT
ncbi:hypothetical protein ACIBQ5_37320 [Streptomyces massasporeus]|uniref:hypothetical protein n=1 Tax=Streptomyces massasporeus TaxID=67324 RepID=UPI0037B58AE0